MQKNLHLTLQLRLKKSSFNALFGDTKLIERFTNLGYSVEEATEMTLKSMAMDRRAAALEGRTTAEQVAEAARYAKSLQTISKLTGKQADQLQDEMQAQMADGAVGFGRKDRRSIRCDCRYPAPGKTERTGPERFRHTAMDS